jgi:hypothetical protein
VAVTLNRSPDFAAAKSGSGGAGLSDLAVVAMSDPDFAALNPGYGQSF